MPCPIRKIAFRFWGLACCLVYVATTNARNTHTYIVTKKIISRANNKYGCGGKRWECRSNQS